MPASLQTLKRHQAKLRQCQRCPQMNGPPVTGNAVISSVMLVGQAPGFKEIEVHRPFAWTAGKTLFKWFQQLGVNEATFRHNIYMCAVCRCFPGKNARGSGGGGDRVPDQDEIEHCQYWLDREMQMLEPQLIIPVGKLAISRFMPVNQLVDVIGKQHQLSMQHGKVDCIPLPHPSGASTWHRMEPGKSLLEKALTLVSRHPAWKSITFSSE